MLTRNITRYRHLKGFMASATGKRGMERLAALGASWDRTALPPEILEALGKAPHAPPLPSLDTFRDRASFLAGACWVLALAANRSEGR